VPTGDGQVIESAERTIGLLLLVRDVPILIVGTLMLIPPAPVVVTAPVKVVVPCPSLCLKLPALMVELKVVLFALVIVRVPSASFEPTAPPKVIFPPVPAFKVKS